VTTARSEGEELAPLPVATKNKSKRTPMDVQISPAGKAMGECRRTGADLVATTYARQSSSMFEMMVKPGFGALIAMDNLH
jgi:hypothetical protein